MWAQSSLACACYSRCDTCLQAGEQQLLEQLGASLMAEEASHKEALAALRIEFGEVLSRRSTAPPLEVAGDYFVLPAETDEQEDLEARQMEMGGEEGGEEGGEGENDMMAEGNGREEGSHMLQGAGAIADHHKAVDTRGGGGAVLQLPAETTPATSSSSVNNTTRIDSSVLARIVKLEKQLRGRPRAQLVERVSQELGVEASCVEDHLSSLARRKGYTARRRGLVAAWEERRRELGRQARKLLQEEAAREGSTAEQKTQASAACVGRGRSLNCSRVVGCTLCRRSCLRHSESSCTQSLACFQKRGRKERQRQRSFLPPPLPQALPGSACGGIAIHTSKFTLNPSPSISRPLATVGSSDVCCGCLTRRRSARRLKPSRRSWRRPERHARRRSAPTRRL